MLLLDLLKFCMHAHQLLLLFLVAQQLALERKLWQSVQFSLHSLHYHTARLVALCLRYEYLAKQIDLCTKVLFVRVRPEEIEFAFLVERHGLSKVLIHARAAEVPVLLGVVLLDLSPLPEVFFLTASGDGPVSWLRRAGSGLVVLSFCALVELLSALNSLGEVPLPV